MAARIAKSLLATAMACVPFFIRSWFPTDPAQSFAFFVFAGVVGAINYFVVFQPDERFLAARTPTLDTILKKHMETLGTFATTDGEGNQRMGCRAHVFQMRGVWPIRWLEMAYTYHSDNHDPDLGICWWKLACCRGQGLVWKVWEAGEMGLFKRPPNTDGEDVQRDFKLGKRKAKATRKVAAILAFPLRSSATKKGRAINPRVRAVMCIDTLRSEHVAKLDRIYHQIESGNGRDWVELVDTVGFYF